MYLKKICSRVVSELFSKRTRNKQQKISDCLVAATFSILGLILMLKRFPEVTEHNEAVIMLLICATFFLLGTMTALCHVWKEQLKAHRKLVCEG